MNAANLEKSKRLKRVMNLLSDGMPRSTLQIVQGAAVCAVSSIISELRANGVEISCKRQGDVWVYRMADDDSDYGYVKRMGL